MSVQHSPTLKEPSAVRYFKKTFVRFGLAKKVKHRNGAIFFKFLWKRIAILLAATAFVGYSVLVAGAYFFIKYERDFAEIRYVDLFFPHRWEHYREARGNYYIERAQRILAGDEDIEGHPFLLLRTGVGLSPGNDEGRLALARLYQQIGQLPNAIRVLEPRIEENARNTEYLQTFFTLLFNDFQDDRIIELGERLLAEGDSETERRDHMVATAVATAYHYRGDDARAEEYIDDYNLMTSKDGFLLQTRIDWDRGNEERAIGRLEEMIEAGTPHHDIFLVLVDYLLRSGREERAARMALLRHVSDPLSYEPLLGLLQIHQRTGDETMLEEDTELYLSQFGGEEEAMHRLSALAGNWGDFELAERIYRKCLENGMDTEPPAYHRVEALVQAGRYRQALDLVGEWDEVPSEWERGYALPLKAQIAVAHYGVGNRGEGQLLIGELFGDGFVRPEHLATLADRLIAMDEYPQARRILAHVRNNYPRYQAALSQLIELDIDTRNRGDVVRNVQQYITTRKPSPEVLQKAYAFIGSDLFLFDAERDDVLHSLENVLEEG